MVFLGDLGGFRGISEDLWVFLGDFERLNVFFGDLWVFFCDLWVFFGDLCGFTGIDWGFRGFMRINVDFWGLMWN